MEPIQYLVDKIFQTVDNRLIELAFMPDPFYDSNKHYSLEHIVRQKVIYEGLIVDLQMTGGMYRNVSIIGLNPEQVEGGYIYRIPLSRTQGRHMIAAYAVEDGMATFEPVRGFGINGMANRLLNATGGITPTGSSLIDVPSPNVLFLSENLINRVDYVRGMIEMDKNLNGYGVHYLPEIAKAAILKCQLMIFAKLNSMIGDGGGNGSVNQYQRSALDRMEGANELYDEMIEMVLPKLNLLQDREAMRDIVQMQIMGI